MLTQQRLTEIAAGLRAASTWVIGTRSTTLIGYSEELDAAAGEQVGTPTAADKAAADKAAADKADEKIKAKSS